jgi:hypothetical protein
MGVVGLSSGLRSVVNQYPGPHSHSGLMVSSGDSLIKPSQRISNFGQGGGSWGGFWVNRGEAFVV